MSVVAVVLVAGCGAAATPDAATPSTTTSPSTTAAPPPPSCALPEDGRTVRVAEPDGRSGPAPLIVSLHGHGSSASRHEGTTDMAATGTARGFVVVTPQGEGDPRRWNFDQRPDGPDDFAFVDGLVAHLVEAGCADPDRVFVVGSSNGAAFAGLLVCRPPHRFAAVAMVIATVPVRCDDAPSVLTVRGTADERVPYAGTPEAVADDAAHHGCSAEPRAGTLRPDLEELRWTGCRDGGEVVLVSVVGGTHAWPDGATDAVLDLFARTAA